MRKTATQAFIIIASVLLLGGISVVALRRERESPPAEDKPVETSARELREEKAEIDAWIAENGLNQYGDPKDTVYLGGTPLFDERSGRTLDRHEYVIRAHPEKPWRK